MPSAVITGANSGIGHEFAKVLIDAVSLQGHLTTTRCGQRFESDESEQGYDVHAVDMNHGEKLKSSGCKTSQLDVASEQLIQRFKDQYGDQPLDLLLNVAGKNAKPTTGKREGPTGHRDGWSLKKNREKGVADPDHDSLDTLSKDSLTRTFSINTFGPLLLTQALLPNVLRSSQPRLGYVSSRVGSIADNSSGGNYAYRSSKTALNMICKNLAVELKAEGVVVVVLHPGIVRTGLIPGAGDVPGAVEPDEAASKLYKILVSKEIEDTGKFWHREGGELPW